MQTALTDTRTCIACTYHTKTALCCMCERVHMCVCVCVCDAMLLVSFSVYKSSQQFLFCFQGAHDGASVISVEQFYVIHLQLASFLSVFGERARTHTHTHTYKHALTNTQTDWKTGETGRTLTHAMSQRCNKICKVYFKITYGVKIMQRCITPRSTYYEQDSARANLKKSQSLCQRTPTKTMP